MKSISIAPNIVDVQAYDASFFAAYTHCVTRPTQKTPNSIGFEFGTFRSRANKWFAAKGLHRHIQNVSKSTSVFSIAMEKATVLEDPIAGYGVHLLPDKLAQNALWDLYVRIVKNKSGIKLNLEREEFTPIASLFWVRTLDEANAITEDLNAMNFCIQGEIDEIVIFDLQNPRKEKRSFHLQG